MACLGCQKRREIGKSIIQASRNGDIAGVRSGLRLMSASVREDVQRNAKPVQLKLTDAAKKAFHRT
jgi:hypothetical protein